LALLLERSEMRDAARIVGAVVLGRVPGFDERAVVEVDGAADSRLPSGISSSMRWRMVNSRRSTFSSPHASSGRVSNVSAMRYL